MAGAAHHAANIVEACVPDTQVPGIELPQDFGHGLVLGLGFTLRFRVRVRIRVKVHVGIRVCFRVAICIRARHRVHKVV